MSGVDSLHPVVRNNKEVMLDFACTAAEGRIWNEPGFTAYYTGLPDSIFNAIIELDREEHEAEMAVESFLTHCRERNAPSTVFLSEDTEADGLARILERKGFHFSHRTPGMVYPSLQSFRLSDQSETLEFKSCRNREQREDFHQLFEVFEMSEASYDLYCDFLSSSNKMHQVVGYAEGVPVCTSAAYFGSDCAGIYTVATVAEARGRGFGRAATEYCLDMARKQRYEFAVLTSSKLGYSVYEKIGFEEVLKVGYYESQL